jgi:murein DD-endopeptidase MepM/ murein hydrolase activator NlpD
MHRIAPLPRFLLTTTLAAAALAALPASPALAVESEFDPSQPQVTLPKPAVRVASADVRTLRVPISVTEPVLVQASARGATGIARTRTARRDAGRTAVVLPLRRRAVLQRAFDRGRAVSLAVQVVATDREGKTAVTARTIRILPPRGYVPTDQMLTPMPGFATTSGFGQRWGRLHAGVDIPAPSGTPIRAARDGVVTSVGWDGGYGQTTVVDHGPYSTKYAHQSAVYVHPGQHVARGESIGAVGNTGSSTGAHLHFEVHVGGAPQNPMSYLH